MGGSQPNNPSLNMSVGVPPIIGISRDFILLIVKTTTMYTVRANILGSKPITNDKQGFMILVKTDSKDKHAKEIWLKGDDARNFDRNAKSITVDVNEPGDTFIAKTDSNRLVPVDPSKPEGEKIPAFKAGEEVTRLTHSVTVFSLNEVEHKLSDEDLMNSIIGANPTAKFSIR